MNGNLAVIIPFFQREPGLLRRSVLSILEQETPHRAHIIVVDDGSPVSAEGELADLPRGEHGGQIKVIRRENGGVGAARNSGLDALPDDIEFVSFLDSDDWWTPAHQQKMCFAFAAGADFYFCNHKRPEARFSSFDISGPERLSGPRIDTNTNIFWLEGDFLDLVIKNSPLTPSTGAYRRNPDTETVRFSPVFRRSCEDRLFFADLSRSVRSVAFSPDCDVEYGTGVNIFASATWGTLKGLERVLDTARFHNIMAAQFRLSDVQREWNRQAIAQLDVEFSENQVVLLLKERSIPLSVIREYLSIRPKLLGVAPLVLLRFIWNRLQSRRGMAFR